MNIKELKLKNYRSYREETIAFDEEVYIILGQITGSEKSNGSGKSSIFSAIVTALYGNLTDTDIHNNEGSSEISLSFEANSKDYKITRKLERGKTQTVFINKKKYGIKDAQGIIIDLLGANLDIYTNTAYFKQGDLDSFSKLTPKEAKDVVINILQLGVYNDYEKAVKEKQATLKSDIQTLDSKISTTQAMVEKEKIEKAESKYSEKDLKEATALLKNYELKVNLEKMLRDSKESILSVINKKIDKVNNAYRELTFAKQSKADRIKKLKTLKNKATCPTCEHELNKNEIEIIIDTIQESIKSEDGKMLPLKTNLEKLDNMKKEVSKVDTSIKKEHTEAELVSKITMIKSELKQKAKDENKIKELEKSIDEAKLESALKKGLLNRYDSLRTAFGRNGIQAYIIENVLPEVQVTANDILEGLDTDIRISIDSQKDLKKGGKAETLDINVINEYGERPYSNYSGGEKTFIDFSLRMALSIILARRSNCQIQTLILDEVFGELDAVNKQIVSKALRYISGKFNFKKILIISHADELQDSCDNIIKVKFNGKYSTVTKESKNATIARSA